MREIAADLAIIPGIIANAYLAGTRDRWVLVDACTPGNHGKILRAAEARFGAGAKPHAIWLTHGHFDHAGSAPELAALWNVPVFAHTSELPYLTGKAHYPPYDASKPGFFSKLVRFFPPRTVDLSGKVREFRGEFDGWDLLETPGHTPGHVSFFRPTDGALLAGDALTTMDLDSMWGTLGKGRKVCRPPVPATLNWQDARESVRKLAGLRPKLIAAGHGHPMRDAAAELRALGRPLPNPVTIYGSGPETPPTGPHPSIRVVPPYRRASLWQVSPAANVSQLQPADAYCVSTMRFRSRAFSTA